MLQKFSQYRGLLSLEGLRFEWLFLGTNLVGYKSALGFFWILQVPSFSDISEQLRQLPLSHTHTSNHRVLGTEGRGLSHTASTAQRQELHFQVPHAHAKHAASGKLDVEFNRQCYKM